MSQTEQLELLQDRCATYALLARLFFSEPSADFLRSLIDTAPSTDDADGLGDQANLLPAFLRSLRGRDVEGVLFDLRTEYTSLFLNVGRIPIYPYESVYTSPERLLMQRAYDEVVQIYAEAGLSRPADSHEPEDHIAMELGFMAHLCQKALDALRNGDVETALSSLRQQADFHRKHLAGWVSDLCRDIAATATSDFYRGAATITDEFIAMESGAILALIDDLQDQPA